MLQMQMPPVVSNQYGEMDSGYVTCRSDCVYSELHHILKRSIRMIDMLLKVLNSLL